MPQDKKKEKKLPEKYIERVLTVSALNKGQLNKLYKAVLEAAQYTAYQNEGNAFRLLEGVVKKNKHGEYIFIPNQHLEKLLEGADYPLLLQIEESRFVELIKSILAEMDPNGE